MPTPPALTRAGRARAVALGDPAVAPAGRLSRLRATAAAGGLAVLLGSSLAGHLPSAAGDLSRTAVSVSSTGLTAVAGPLGAVARTGGR